MRLRPLRTGAGSLALAALALAYPVPGADGGRAAEDVWGATPEPALHRLLRDLVREARARRPCVGTTPP